MVTAFLHGFILAFGLILPLGVQNVFVFNQGAREPSFLKTLPVIATAGLCDTTLIVIAVLGVSVVVFEIPWIVILVYLVGFVFLVIMGWRVWQDASEPKSNQVEGGVFRQVMFALSASLLNPHALLDTIGVIGTVSLMYHGTAKWGYTIACILVSWIWFISLAIAGRSLKTIDSNGFIIRLLNQISALIIWGVACFFGWKMGQFFLK